MYQLTLAIRFIIKETLRKAVSLGSIKLTVGTVS